MTFREPLTGGAFDSRVMREQMDRQIHADGSSFEQSTYYQEVRSRYVSATRGPASAAEYLAKLQHMAEYLDALYGPFRPATHVG